MGEDEPVTTEILDESDIPAARRTARQAATSVGLDETETEELALALTELATNILKYAERGTITITPLTDGDRRGVRVDADDDGPGLDLLDDAVTDRTTTSGSLGYGLGAVNRLMDDLEIRPSEESGTHLRATKWSRNDETPAKRTPISIGAATRPKPGQKENGDTFVIEQWGEHALAGVIDGVGHGQLAHAASTKARQYVEQHHDQSLDRIFRGAGRACRGTRGAVMALARFDWSRDHVTIGSIGNIAVRTFHTPEPLHVVARRGILGVNAQKPLLTTSEWKPGSLMVIHSDGITSRWEWDDHPDLHGADATETARALLRRLSKEKDDATVLVIKEGDP